MKRTVTTLTVVVMLIVSGALIHQTQASDTILGVDPANLQLPTADFQQTLQVDIKISDVQDLWAWCITNITFNSNVLNLTQIEEGPFLKQGGNTLFIWPEDSPKIRGGIVPELSATLMTDGGVSGSGILATLTFNVLSAGNSQINIDDTKLLDLNELSNTTTTDIYHQIDCTTTNGYVTIENLSSPTPAPSNDTKEPLNNSNILFYIGIAVSFVVALAIFIVFIGRKSRRK